MSDFRTFGVPPPFGDLGVAAPRGDLGVAPPRGDLSPLLGAAEALEVFVVCRCGVSTRCFLGDLLPASDAARLTAGVALGDTAALGDDTFLGDFGNATSESTGDLRACNSNFDLATGEDFAFAVALRALLLPTLPLPR